MQCHSNLMVEMASIGTSHSLKLHNQFHMGKSFWTALNVGCSSNWHPLRLNFNSRSPPGAKRPSSNHSPPKKSLSGISETHDDWTVVRASATPPLIPLEALASVLQRVKERLHFGGERGYPLIKTMVKKWLRGLQSCGGNNILRVSELGNARFLQHGGIGMALLSTTSMAREHISPVLGTLGANPTFMSGLLAWLIAQMLKVFITFIVERRWDLKMLVGSGGMPSSHAALCIGLTTSVALCHGVSDCLFPVCLGFSLIVMYDATGVRRHAGMQAEVLNMIVEDLFKGHPISERKLKELLGHTPLQVFAGACLGVLVGYLCSQSSSVTA